MSITAGIDVGSTYTKAIVLDSENRILGRRLERRQALRRGSHRGHRR